MKIAKADLVPTDANLLEGYASWSELTKACEAFMAEVNARDHRVTRRAPADALVEERSLAPPPRAALHRRLRRDPPSHLVGHHQLRRSDLIARFADGDLVSIFAAHPVSERRRAGDGHSLQSGTGAWEGFGR